MTFTSLHGDMVFALQLGCRMAIRTVLADLKLQLGNLHSRPLRLVTNVPQLHGQQQKGHGPKQSSMQERFCCLLLCLLVLVVCR